MVLYVAGANPLQTHMARLQHSLNNARGNPEKDFHLAFELNRIFEEIERTGEINKDTKIELREIEDDFSMSEIYMYVEHWYSDRDFQAVRSVQPLLQDGITYALNNDWHNVAAEYHYQLIYLQSNLSGHDADTEIRNALSFLNDNQEEVTSTIAIRIIDLINKNIDSVDNNRKDELVRFIQSARKEAHSKKEFDTERSYLRRLHNLKTRYNEDTTSLEDDLIETYRLEANWQENNSLLMKADVLRSGVNECGQYMSEEKEEDWKKEALEARRKGTEEMIELSPGNLPNTNYEGDLQEDINNEVEENIEIITSSFKYLEERYDSTHALYCILCSEDLIPDTTRMRLNSEQFVLQEMVSRMVISPEYNTISKEPSDQESIPSNYGMQAISRMNAAANAFYQLIKEEYLSINDFVLLLQASNSLSPDTEAFLTEALFDMFDDNHVQSLFIALPHIEGVVVDTLSSVGRTAYTSIEGGTQQQTLGGLFRETNDFDQDYTIYLRYRYTSREGMNLRNRAAHGQLRYVNANYLSSIMTIYDILRIIVQINPSPYLRMFGPPENTLPKSTNYGKSIDLSLYTDLNRQVIGYGESNDQHSFIVIRKDRNEDKTELFVEKGRISRYEIGRAEMERNEIIAEINALSNEYVEMPADIEYRWLTDERILNELIDIVQDISDCESDEVQKEAAFEQARRKGIDESTARIAFDQLEENGDIEQSEDIVSLTG